MILDKINLLRDILNERLPYIKRWSKVGIYFPGDKFPTDTMTEEDVEPGYFYIVWSSRKKVENPHPYEYKQVPLTIDDLNAVIKRQREKWRTESNNA
jgi:hypothetical protein